MSLFFKRFYRFLVKIEPQKNTLSKEAFENVGRNFTLNVGNGTLTKLAEKIISPNLTLPWIMSSLGASAGIIGALVPVKDAGSLLPQLAVSGKIRNFQIRKKFWVMAAMLQAVCWLAAGLLLLFTSVSFISIILLGLLAIFSIASGVASVAYKDVTAKTIPKKIRGQMLSYRATFGGVLGLIAGAVLIFVIKENKNTAIYAYMFFTASLLWFLAALLFLAIQEEKEEAKQARNFFEEVKEGISLIKKDTGFRNFLFTRALLMAIPLLQPFYVLEAKQINTPHLNMLGYLIIINGLATVVSSPFWGKIADQSSTRLMRIASFISIAGGIYALGFYYFPQLGFFAFLPVFFINGIAYSGARLSRKTYLVNYAPESDRPTYISVASTFIGLFTVLAATFGIVAEIFGLPVQILFFVGLLALAIFLSFKLPSVEEKQ